MTNLKCVVDRVNLRVMDLQPSETADLILIQELHRAGIDEVELGTGYEMPDEGWWWSYVGLRQYGGSGRLALITEKG